ncbi:hypothetical protein TNCV_1816431 [Trichonephila clavipes]|nr:hypothetical protein TNCV_1816431 [Trichonephila clavipes]
MAVVSISREVPIKPFQISARCQGDISLQEILLLFLFGPCNANYLQFWFRRFRSGIFDVKDAPCTSRPVIKNVEEITEIIEIDLHVSSRIIAQELQFDIKQL